MWNDAILLASCFGAVHRRRWSFAVMSKCWNMSKIRTNIVWTIWTIREWRIASRIRSWCVQHVWQPSLWPCFCHGCWLGRRRDQPLPPIDHYGQSTLIVQLQYANLKLFMKDIHSNNIQQLLNEPCALSSTTWTRYYPRIINADHVPFENARTSSSYTVIIIY